MTNEQVDTLTAPQMAAWLRETAANTRQHSDRDWCLAHGKPLDHVAAHVAFRMEQAAELLERLSPEPQEKPVAWRRLINSEFERHPRYGYSETPFQGGEPLYTRQSQNRKR